VRQIEDDVYRKLRDRASRHGVSMEEEVRRILRASVRAPERLGDLAYELFGANGIDLELPERTAHDPLDLNGTSKPAVSR
ncbi:MAG: FitA-like ribbon-helix-helix domain-containing protein, partial [Spirochaetaceae bacterium]